MKILKLLMLTLLLSGLKVSFAMGIEDDPVVSLVKVDQLERRYTDGKDIVVWSADAWVGYDLHKFWLKTKGERVANTTESAELQLLYSKAVSPFWALQFGVKRDFQPTPNRTWAVITANGLAPYMIETDASLFIGKSGRLSVQLDAEYEYMLTQKWVLVPELEFSVFSKDDAETETGKGLAKVEAGLRLGYEISREFAPYIGINWERKFGKTADFAREHGEGVEDTQLLLGVRFWF